MRTVVLQSFGNLSRRQLSPIRESFFRKLQLFASDQGARSRGSEVRRGGEGFDEELVGWFCEFGEHSIKKLNDLLRFLNPTNK